MYNTQTFKCFLYNITIYLFSFFSDFFNMKRSHEDTPDTSGLIPENKGFRQFRDTTSDFNGVRLDHALAKNMSISLDDRPDNDPLHCESCEKILSFSQDPPSSCEGCVARHLHAALPDTSTSMVAKCVNHPQKK